MHGTYRFSVSGEGETQEVRFDQLGIDEADDSWSQRLMRKPLLLLAVSAVAITGISIGAFTLNDSGTSGVPEVALVSPEAPSTATTPVAIPAVIPSTVSAVQPEATLPQASVQDPITSPAPSLLLEQAPIEVTPTQAAPQPVRVSVEAAAVITKPAAIPTPTRRAATIVPPAPAPTPVQARSPVQARQAQAPTSTPAVLRIALPEVTPFVAAPVQSAPIEPVAAPIITAPVVVAPSPPAWKLARQDAASNPRAIEAGQQSGSVRILLADVPRDRPPLPALITAPIIIPATPQPQVDFTRPMLSQAPSGPPAPPLRPQDTAPVILATRETAAQSRPVAAKKTPPAVAMAVPAPSRALDRRVDMDQISRARPKRVALTPQMQATPASRPAKQPSLASAIDAMQIGTPALPNLSGSQRAELMTDAPNLLTLRRDGVDIGQISVRMGERNRFEVQLSGLLKLATGQLPAAELDRLRTSDAAQKYVPLDHLRDLGIELDYDPVYDEIRLNG